jgi:DNA-binding MarR family transcriptional regulator
LLIADVLELVGLSRASSDRMARELGQTVARWHLMSVLSDGPRSVASAARRLGLARQSVQRVANDLVQHGLAISVPDPNDARAPLFELTSTGHDLVTQLFARSEADRQDLVATAGLSAQELLAARSTIRALIDQLIARDQTPPD